MKPVLILRPEPGASATAQRARAAGLTVRSHPLFAAVALPWATPEGTFDALLVTSANAVRLADTLPELPAYAVGHASAMAAKGAGLDVRGVGSRDVAHLLDQLPSDLRLLHLTGEDRILPEDARQSTTSVALYRMEPLPPPAAALIEGAVALIHSPAAGRRLQELEAKKARISIAAISAAAADACGPGWERCEAAPAPNDEALPSLAAKLCDSGRP